MGYAGQTYAIPCDKGGFSYNKNVDLIPPQMFVAPSRNINLHQNGREKRGGTAKVNSTAVSGSPQILGLFDFRVGANSFQVFAASDGKIYKDSTTVLKTGMSTSAKFNFAVFGNELYICDGASTPQTWDGAAGSTSNITTSAADWSTTKPFQMIAHGRGASRRMWAIAGNAVYYSSLANGKEFAGGTSGKITIDVIDAYGLVGGVEFGDRLIVFDRAQAYVIDDSDATVANWGYELAQWTGGAAHWRGILKTDNDVLIMAEDGQLYSITGAQEYGDYKLASLMRKQFIDNYMKATAAMTLISEFHLVFDRNLRAVKYFFIRSGQTTVDSALVFFIDRGIDDGWVVHDNQTTNSGYAASCSAEVRSGAGTYLVYTGDYSGFIWKLEQSARVDGASGYYGGFKTPNLNLDNPRMRKHFRRIYVIMEAVGDYNLSVNIWLDGVNQTSTTINMGAAGTGLGSFILDTSQLGGLEFIDANADLNMIGKRLQLEFFNSNSNQTFFVSQLLIDFKPLPATV